MGIIGTDSQYCFLIAGNSDINFMVILSMEALYSQITHGYFWSSSPQRPDGLSEEIVYSFGRAAIAGNASLWLYLL